MVRLTCSILSSAVLAVLVALPSAADAQIAPEADLLAGMRTGVGYAGSMPDILLGASAFHLFSDGGFGAVVDFKMGHETIKGNPSYIEEWTSEWVQENRGDTDTLLRSTPDRRNDRNDEWMVINAGLMRPISGDFAVIAGAGAANRTAIDEFTTVEAGITPTEWYWVQNETESGWELNLHGSVLFKAGRHVLLRFGYDRAPRMLSIGGYWVLSR